MSKTLSREEIERRLLALERAPAPDTAEFRPGAMCYGPPAPRDFWVYVCSACGQRTAYGSRPDLEEHSGQRDAKRGVPDCMIKSLERLESVLPLARRLSRRSTFTLDESALCASCQPDARTWRPVFKIQLPGEAPRELSLGEDDLLLLDAFLKGADRYKSSHDEEGPMSTQVGRLRALLLGEESDSDEDADE